MVFENLRRVRERIASAATRAGRDPSKVELVAVVKQAPMQALRDLLAEGGVRHLGENRVQDAQRRREELGPGHAGVSWRFVGHLQTNKVRPALELFEWIDSLDSLKLAQALQARLEESRRVLPVLVRVKLADSDAQSGIAPESLSEFLEALKALPRLAPRGLMTIAPNLEPLEAVRPAFRRMRELRERHFGVQGLLSMGMSRDFEIAVEEGADLVRVGSALFEPEPSRA